MPIKRAALRSLRKDKRRTSRNQAHESELKTLKKRMLTLVVQNRAEAEKLLPEVMRRFDQAAAKGRIHKNQAASFKSRLMHRLAATPAK